MESYPNIDDFILKPGHKALLIKLSKKIDIHLKEEESKKGKRKETSENSQSEDDIKDDIVLILTNYMRDEKRAETFTLNDISSFEKNENGFQCRILCKFCSKKLRVNYTSYWHAHNFKVHLKKHISKSSQSKGGAAEKNQNDKPFQANSTQNQRTAAEYTLSFSQF